jgi:hypothetical protein
MSEPVFSIIAPIYNELENLPLLYARVGEVMNQMTAAQMVPRISSADSLRRMSACVRSFLPATSGTKLR